MLEIFTQAGNVSFSSAMQRKYVLWKKHVIRGSEHTVSVHNIYVPEHLKPYVLLFSHVKVTLGRGVLKPGPVDYIQVYTHGATASMFERDDYAVYVYVPIDMYPLAIEDPKYGIVALADNGVDITFSSALTYLNIVYAAPVLIKSPNPSLPDEYLPRIDITLPPTPEGLRYLHCINACTVSRAYASGFVGFGNRLEEEDTYSYFTRALPFNTGRNNILRLRLGDISSTSSDYFKETGPYDIAGTVYIDFETYYFFVLVATIPEPLTPDERVYS